MQYDATDRVKEARAYFDSLLDERIDKIAELAGVPRDCFVKINPADFLEKNKYQLIRGYEYQDLGKWIAANKKDDHTFLISPCDAIVETAAQCSYKSNVEIWRTLRASKCDCVPVPSELALDFFIRNHRQSLPPVRRSAVCFGLVYKDELVAVMLYDITNGAVRGGKTNYELLRLSIAKGTKIQGGASKLQAACEETLRQMGINEIYSYSNATINSGAVYGKLGFACKGMEAGQPFVILKSNKITRLINLFPISTDKKLAEHGWLKCHIGGNKMWVKKIGGVKRE